MPGFVLYRLLGDGTRTPIATVQADDIGDACQRADTMYAQPLAITAVVHTPARDLVVVMDREATADAIARDRECVTNYRLWLRSQGKRA